MDVSNGFTKRIVIRMDDALYKWVMENGGAPTAREILEKRKAYEEKKYK